MKTEVQSRRMAVMCVTPEFLLEMCKGGPPRVIQAVGNLLPDDAEFVRTEYDQWSNILRLVVHSKSFAEVPEGDRFPQLAPTILKQVEYRGRKLWNE